MNRTEARRRAERAGHMAERVAALLLRLKGYRLVGRRVRTPLGELDLLARRGGVLAVVEVKARSGHGAALEAISERQRRRIAKAAEAVLARDPRLAGLTLRFDVVAVGRWRLPLHIIDAWRPDSPGPPGLPAVRRRRPVVGR